MSESVQKKLLVARPPRIKILYELETNGAKISKELPARFGIIGDFSGTRDESKPFLDYKERQFINLDSDNFDEVFKSLTPRIIVPLLEEDGKTTTTLELILETISDFSPLNLVKKIDILFKLYNQKKSLSELRVKYDLNRKNGAVLDTLLSDTGLQDTLKKQIEAFLGLGVEGKGEESSEPAAAEEGKNTGGKELLDLLEKIKSATDQQKKHLCDLVYNYIGIIKENTENIKETKFVDYCNRFFIFVDKKTSNYLNQILHNPDFQKLEGRWKGLEYVMNNMTFSTSSKLSLLNASDDEIFEDLTTTMEFDQSHLFKLIYSNEFGTLGGIPYTAIMWDHSLSRSAKEFGLLSKITEVIASAHCPLILGVDPSLFDLQSFENLPDPYSMDSLFSSVELAEFNGFRESEDAKYVTFVLPRIIARAPYNTEESPIIGLNFVENISPLRNEDYTWMNAAYAYFVKVTNSFAGSGWFNNICGTENGGKVENLPLYLFKTTHGDYQAKCPTEVAITDRREKELSDLGFISICHAKNTNYAVFFSNNSSFKPPVFLDEKANSNAELSRRTPYMLNISRFAHYLKCIMRDKVGSFATKEEVNAYLSSWLAQYTLLDDKAQAALKLKYPLREFSLTVEEIPGKPGHFSAVMLLRPHGEIQGMEISLRLVNQIK